MYVLLAITIVCLLDGSFFCGAFLRTCDSSLHLFQQQGCFQNTLKALRSSLRQSSTESGQREHASYGSGVAVAAAARAAPYNVVLCHATADFDSLASAVGLARLWAEEEPGRAAWVVLPAGAHPGVAAFLALHRNVFPVRGAKALDPALARRVGVVDASRRDRLGAAGLAFVDAPGARVTVVDHHAHMDTDLNPESFRCEATGSVSTIVTEMLMERNIELTDAEATLMALGIHADTGSLTFDSATHRDAQALAWLMSNGVNQQVINSYSHQSLSSEQQHYLMEAFRTLRQEEHNGATIGYVAMAGDAYVAGLSRVAQQLLELTGCDVLLLALAYRQKARRPRDTAVVIGRCRSGAVGAGGEADLAALLGPLGGGGHARAAAATCRLDRLLPPAAGGGGGGGGGGTAESTTKIPAWLEKRLAEKIRGEVGVQQDKDSSVAPQMVEPWTLLEALVEELKSEQMTTQEVTAKDLMSTPALACKSWSCLGDVFEIITRYSIRGLPVVDEADTVVGYVSEEAVVRALREGKRAGSGGEDGPCLTVAACIMPKGPSVSEDAPLHEVERALLEKDAADGAITVERGGAAAAVAGDAAEDAGAPPSPPPRRLVGVISRTDVLRHRHFYGRGSVGGRKRFALKEGVRQVPGPEDWSLPEDQGTGDDKQAKMQRGVVEDKFGEAAVSSELQPSVLGASSTGQQVEESCSKHRDDHKWGSSQHFTSIDCIYIDMVG